MMNLILVSVTVLINICHKGHLISERECLIPSAHFTAIFLYFDFIKSSLALLLK